MKRYLSILLALTMMAGTVACGNKSTSSKSETEIATEESTKVTTTEKIKENTTEPTTTEKVEPATKKTSDIEFIDRCYYNGISIGVSRGWSARTIPNYHCYISCSYFGCITIKCEESDYTNNNDYISSHTSGQVYENANAIKMITATIGEDNNIHTCFYCFNKSQEISIEFSPYFPEDKMYQIINTLKFEDENTEQSTEKPTETTESKTNSNETLSDSEPIIFSGTGDQVTDIFSANGCTTIEANYTGEGVFFVQLFDSEGNVENPCVFSNYGAYQGKKVFKFEDNKSYMFEITSDDSNWTITVK